MVILSPPQYYLLRTPVWDSVIIVPIRDILTLWVIKMFFQPFQNSNLISSVWYDSLQVLAYVKLFIYCDIFTARYTLAIMLLGFIGFLCNISFLAYSINILFKKIMQYSVVLDDDVM